MRGARGSFLGPKQDQNEVDNIAAEGAGKASLRVSWNALGDPGGGQALFLRPPSSSSGGSGSQSGSGGGSGGGKSSGIPRVR